MARTMILCAALLMTLALAAPVAAAERVHIGIHSGPYQFEESADWAGCDGTLYFGFVGRGDLWLWYANGVNESAMMPEDRAWPWVKGLVQDRGTFYFSSEEGMAGRVLSGPFAYQTHLSDHHLGTPDDLANDPESWTETWRGLTLNLRVPGRGAVFHESGTGSYVILVTEYHEYPEEDVYEWGGDLRPFRGNGTYDLEAVCAYFGYDFVG